MNKPNCYSGRKSLIPGISILLMLCFNAFYAEVHAAPPGYFFQNVVRGKITDDKGEPLSGVSVAIQGSNKGVTTNLKGEFSIQASNGQKLSVSYVGYEPQTVTVGDGEIALALKIQSASLTDVVVVGYATQKKVTVTGAVTQVKGAELEKSPAVNLSNSLVGRLPGLTAVQSSGEPGYDGSSIRIRGTNTLGNSEALIVIDGIPDRAGGLDRLNPSDIESFSVLKDASAAIYGARAANGVILITTKRGKSGKPSLSYDFNQGWSQPTYIPKVMDAPEYAIANNELVLFNSVPANQWSAAWQGFNTAGSYTRTDDNSVVNAAYKPADIQKYRDGSDPWGHPNTDWFGDALRKWAPQQRHNVQVNGGSENVRYLASLGYLDQDGIYKQSATGFKQYDIRLNLDVKVNKYINTSIGVSGREEFRFFPTESAGSIFRMLMRGKPTEPEYWPNGLPGPDIENGQNPAVIVTNQTGYDRDKRDYVQSNGKIEINIPGVDGLKITGTASLDKFYYNRKVWQTPWYLYFWDKTTFEADGVTPKLTKSVRSTYTDPRLTEANETRLNVLLGAMLNYDRKFGDHTINFLAALTKETIKDDNFNAFRRNFISPSIDQLFAGGSSAQNVSGGAYERARLSYFGRVGYNFREKYIAEFLWRYDGSYIFPESDRFGFFPGLLVGWNISQENFFRNALPIVNFLKLRASYGQMGNDQVYYNDKLQEYAYLSTYGFSSYILNDQVQKSLYESRLANPNFTWEVANNANVGLEGALLNNKINFEFEYFYNKRTQILWQRSGSTPGSAGLILPPENFGKVSNRGWEFKISHGGTVNRDLRYNVSVNGGYAKNKILYYDEAAGAPDWQKATGKGFGSDGVNYLVYEYDGVFRDQADIDKTSLDYSAVTGTLRPGDMKFRDINGDGKITGDDATRLEKNRDPKFTGGVNITVNYKNFDLSILFQGAAGGLLFIGTESGDIGNYLQYSWDHRWSVDNPSSVDPRLANRGDTYYTGGGFGNNTYWLRSSNYLRLKNVELGYNLPTAISERVSISKLRLYVSALNLATWDKMKIYDPEATQGDGKYYPQSRLINTGIRITF